MDNPDNEPATATTCAYCGKPDATARDHVVPRSRGGPDNATNIVMACQSCNSSKGASLPSEWLGDRCPAAVRLIEKQVNEKLRKGFQHRDGKRSGKLKSDPLFAAHMEPDGGVGYAGQVISEAGGRIRLNAADGVMLTFCGMWTLSGSIYDVKASECRLFSDKQSCGRFVIDTNNRLYGRHERTV